MNHDFFAAKKPWSLYKDAILKYYLEPYIPKVALLRRPVLIVDCFAGCGRFGDGGAGSPIIIAEAVGRWRAKACNVSGEFIEADATNFALLEQSLTPYKSFSKVRHGTFESCLPEFAQRAARESIFLYVDPYTVKALKFDKMKSVYDQIQSSRASVELLLNFNVAIFMRWALAALKRVDELPPDATNEESDYQTDDPGEKVEIKELNGIAGGEYWIDIARSASLSFAEKLNEMAWQYTGKLQASFSHVCAYPVKSKYEHQTPKYMLIFATRHMDGIELMNDAMCKARQAFLGAQFVKGKLFDMTPPDEAADIEGLDAAVLEILTGDPITREQLRHKVLQDHFCRFPCKEINGSVRRLLKERKLFSSNGKAVINDSVLLKRTQFGS